MRQYITERSDTNTKVDKRRKKMNEAREQQRREQKTIRTT